jgi:hypothetical protein
VRLTNPNPITQFKVEVKAEVEVENSPHKNTEDHRRLGASQITEINQIGTSITNYKVPFGEFRVPLNNRLDSFSTKCAFC